MSVSLVQQNVDKLPQQKKENPDPENMSYIDYNTQCYTDKTHLTTGMSNDKKFYKKKTTDRGTNEQNFTLISPYLAEMLSIFNTKIKEYNDSKDSNVKIVIPEINVNKTLRLSTTYDNVIYSKQKGKDFKLTVNKDVQKARVYGLISSNLDLDIQHHLYVMHLITKHLGFNDLKIDNTTQADKEIYMIDGFFLDEKSNLLYSNIINNLKKNKQLMSDVDSDILNNSHMAIFQTIVDPDDLSIGKNTHGYTAFKSKPVFVKIKNIFDQTIEEFYQKLKRMNSQKKN